VSPWKKPACVVPASTSASSSLSPGKRRLNASGLKGGCLARVFVMDVTEEMSEWPEQKKRTRRWMPAADAIEICKHDWMRDALRTWASTVPGLSSLVAT